MSNVINFMQEKAKRQPEQFEEVVAIGFDPETGYPVIAILMLAQQNKDSWRSK